MKLELSLSLVRAEGFRVEADLFVETESLALVGPSGAGKTTLLRALAGLEAPARVVIDGTDLSGLSPEARGIGYVAQEPLLFPHLSVRGNLLFSPRAEGLGSVPAALGLEALLDRAPASLSGGEKRRAALGRALLSRPRLLLLDEPFSGLDESARRDAMSLLAAARKRFGVPMVLVSHDAAEVVGLAEQAARVEGGAVAAPVPAAAVLREGEGRIDNYLLGEVEDPGRVRVGGVSLAAAIPDGVSGPVRLACYAHDVLIAGEAPRGLSARNVFETEVSSVSEAGTARLVTLGVPGLRALVTADAASELSLAPGRQVHCVLKATALAYLGKS